MKISFYRSRLLSSILFVALLPACLSQLKTREDLKGQTPGSQSSSNSEVVTSEPLEEQEPEGVPLPAYKQEEKNIQMRTLYGRVEEAETQVRELREAMLELAESRQKEKTESEAKLLAYEEAIKKLETEIATLKNPPVEKKSDKREKSTSSSGKDSNAKLREDYYRGEDFFRQKKWKEAIVAYQKYRESYPKGKFYPESTYKIGLCFVELGLKDESRSFFDEVRLKFPKSSLAKKAEKQLKSLR